MSDIEMVRKPIPLGTQVPPWGKVGAVGTTGGERYYWLIDKRGDVSMMPADMIECVAKLKE